MIWLSWWWRWWCWYVTHDFHEVFRYYDVDVDKNKQRKWWCGHLAFIYSFAHIECSVMIICCDELDDWIWLSVNVHDFDLVFSLIELSTWLNLFDYKFYYGLFTPIWFTYSYVIWLSWPMIPTTTCCYTDVTCALLFIECRVSSIIWNKTSPLSNKSIFSFKGKHYDRANFGPSTHYSRPLFQD